MQRKGYKMVTYIPKIIDNKKIIQLNIIKSFGISSSMNKFAFNQCVYLENYQSFTYGKQKVKCLFIGDGFDLF